MKKLRMKMILVVFFASAVIFALTFLMVCAALLIYHNRQADGMISIISSYGGEVPLLQEYEEAEDLIDLPQYSISFNEESAYRTRYFVVTLDEDLAMITVNLEHVASVDEETALLMAALAAEGSRASGYSDIYRYRVFDGENGSITVIFLDCEESVVFLKAAFIIMGILSIAFPIMITLIFCFLSSRVMVPFEENVRRQKQFITDASHELKTPLAIISANAEVLEYKIGENDWTRNITGQTAHMAELIDDLLTLARMDEDGNASEPEAVNFSELAETAAKNFNEVFLNRQVQLQTQIEESVILYGNRKQLAMLVSILIENASKYVTEGGRARLTLRTTSKYAYFEIFNTAQLDDNLDLKKLFGRFYRPDSSRNSEAGGQGIGLSTAHRITELHDGSISAKRMEDGILFQVSLPLRGKKARKAERGSEKSAAL